MPPRESTRKPDVDLTDQLRAIERKRKKYLREQPPTRHLVTRDLLAALTLNSFRLEGMNVDEGTEAQIFGNRARARAFRSRQAQRLRNHLAILLHMESELRLGRELKADDAVRWYTSISSGLSTAQLAQNTLVRLEQFLRRINSPQLRVQQAIGEIAHLHWQLMEDPLVPSFNGIMARLLLTYHLGRCGLPPVFLGELPAPEAFATEQNWMQALIVMLNESLDILIQLAKE